MNDVSACPPRADAAGVPPVRRTGEIEDLTNAFFIHPVAHWLTHGFARLHVRPNAVSIAGMGFGVAAGFAYAAADRDWRFAVAGFVLMILWHVMDGTDGQLARLTGTGSELGKVLDGICDYATFAAVYLALALGLARDHGALAWWLVGVAGLCHAVQAAAYERERQDYEFWGWNRGAGVSGTTPPTGVAPARSSLQAAYRWVQDLTIGARGTRADLDRALRRDPSGAVAIRDRFRATFARPVRRWSVLSANYRTVGLFACVLAHVPAVYFLVEIFGLSGLLVWLSVRQRARFARFVASVAER